MRPEAGALASWALLAALAGPGAGAARAADTTPQQQVEGQLMCYCGCSDLTVRVCTCGTAESIREDIAARLTDGATPDQVVASYVERYGRQIRSAPTKTGFDLVAWVTPFAVILLAASALVAAVRRWRGGPALAAARAQRGPDPDDSPPGPLDAKALERVRRELREGR